MITQFFFICFLFLILSLKRGFQQTFQFPSVLTFGSLQVRDGVEFSRGKRPLRHLVGHNFVIWLSQGLEYRGYCKCSLVLREQNVSQYMLKRGGPCVTMLKLPKKVQFSQHSCPKHRLSSVHPPLGVSIYKKSVGDLFREFVYCYKREKIDHPCLREPQDL